MQRLNDSWRDSPNWPLCQVDYVAPLYGDARHLPIWGRLTALTYARLSAAEYLPAESRRVILMDSDTLVLADIGLLAGRRPLDRHDRTNGSEGEMGARLIGSTLCSNAARLAALVLGLACLSCGDSAGNGELQDAAFPDAAVADAAVPDGASSDDGDGDGVPNGSDDCPTVADPGQEDLDGDTVGDACDNCPEVANQDQLDANVLEGDEHLGQVLHLIEQSPIWSNTVVIVTFDENGGYWDHVPPPKIDKWGPGMRVPTVIISPFAKKGFIDHTTYDTTAILKLIENRYGLDSLGKRDKNSKDLTAAFDFMPRQAERICKP